MGYNNTNAFNYENNSDRLPSIQQNLQLLLPPCDISSGRDIRDIDNLMGSKAEPRKKTILCIDDNFVNLSSFRLQLEMMGF